MGKLFLLFVIMPIAEIAVLINVGEIIGGWNTVLLVILSAMIGAYLVKREGVSTLAQAQIKLQQGQVPAEEIGSGLMLLVAGVLLVTPGFITDVFGLLLTLPFTRKKIGGVLFHALNGKMHASAHFSQSGFSQSGFSHSDFGQTHAQNDDIIDGEFRETASEDTVQISKIPTERSEDDQPTNPKNDK
ncbi:MAG: FxsA family protein [Glaciecola sp.]|nr:FxsA family protein [Glaciecola sp.]MDG1816611.1 FxsA family protein [Glaciecola sp.]MDG2098231.1 FxsA family protein [Glaciecola sp.]